MPCSTPATSHSIFRQALPRQGPQQPGGKKGFIINKATFEGTGRLNGVGGYPFVGYVIDAGEPAGKKNNDKDFFEIVVRDPNTNAIVFQASVRNLSMIAGPIAMGFVVARLGFAAPYAVAAVAYAVAIAAFGRVPRIPPPEATESRVPSGPAYQARN